MYILEIRKEKGRRRHTPKLRRFHIRCPYCEKTCLDSVLTTPEAPIAWLISVIESCKWCILSKVREGKITKKSHSFFYKKTVLITISLRNKRFLSNQQNRPSHISHGPKKAQNRKKLSKLPKKPGQRRKSGGQNSNYTKFQATEMTKKKKSGWKKVVEGNLITSLILL